MSEWTPDSESFRDKSGFLGKGLIIERATREGKAGHPLLGSSATASDSGKPCCLMSSGVARRVWAQCC
jgi:hypothetical protein